jgi:hypothetical protein
VIKISLYLLAVSGIFLLLAMLESMTGVIGWLAPTGEHAIGWLGAIIIWIVIMRRMTIINIRQMIMPRTRYHQYARRTARANYEQR